MTDPKDVGSRLRTYMRVKGVSTKDIADALFVSEIAVRNWKSGRTSMTLAHAEAVAKLLGIKIDDLLD